MENVPFIFSAPLKYELDLKSYRCFVRYPDMKSVFLA